LRFIVARRMPPRRYRPGKNARLTDRLRAIIRLGIGEGSFASDTSGFYTQSVTGLSTVIGLTPLALAALALPLARTLAVGGRILEKTVLPGAHVGAVAIVQADGTLVGKRTGLIRARV
jgi:hypothetical protein